MGYSENEVIRTEATRKIDTLKKHPNYKDLTPIKGETLVAFTLRYAANLVSPPQYKGESYDVECTTIKAGILSLKEEIEKAFYNFNKGLIIDKMKTIEEQNGNIVGTTTPSSLQLSLKTKWFEMTRSGIKTEDYREINTYWSKRLFSNFEITWKIMTTYYFSEDINRQFHLEQNTDKLEMLLRYVKKFDQNIMTLGYPKSTDIERILKIEHKGIEIRTGNPEWGAEPNKVYFVIKHGAILV